MRKAAYHQESGDILVDLRDHQIPENEKTGQKNWKGKALFVGDEAVVTDPVEGLKVGQYTAIPDAEPDSASKGKSK